MDDFDYRDGRLYAERVDLAEVAAAHGTPCYVYSRATLERHWHAFDEAFGGRPHLVCYAAKANANLAVLDVLARLGSGFDIVSGGELARVLAAGGDASRVVFSGVAKTPVEMRAALAAGILCFNVESTAELEALAGVADEQGVRAPVALRVNPDVDAGTHPYIATGLRENKFGIPAEDALAVYARARELAAIEPRGIACHIGSQITHLDPFVDALDKVLDLVDRLEVEGINLEHIDLGGGLGVRYRDEQPPLPADYAHAVHNRLAGRSFRVLVEPGRAIAGNAGVLLTRVLYLKTSGERRFAVVDAAMNDLARPSLYDAWHDILPLRTHPDRGAGAVYDVVGPVCESGDFLGRGRRLSIEPGDLLAVRTAGAYGFAMSSNYNARPRAAEVMVDGERMQLVRERETVEDLMRGECRVR